MAKIDNILVFGEARQAMIPYGDSVETPLDRRMCPLKLWISKEGCFQETH